MTPAEQNKADIVTRFGLDDLDPHKHSYKPGDPRSFVRSEAHVPEWGNAHYLNQPKSRADSFVSTSILDYGKVEDLGRLMTHRKAKSLSKAKSRTNSRDRTYGSKVWSVEPAIQGNGGLTNAIRAAAREDNFHNIWVGTLGFPTDSIQDSAKDDIKDKLENEYDALVNYIKDRDFDGHYVHYCKTILWPVFHYQIPDHPKSKAYEDHSWKFYRNVNQSFADKIIASYKCGDIIWVHDYHLLLVPGMIREKLPDAQISFFLHTAFPSSEVFRCLSMRKELLEGMLGANLVAFQTREYAQHFLQTCSRILVTESTTEGVSFGERFVNVTSSPIGIDPVALSKAREEQEVAEWVSVLKERYKGKRLIVARDNLDHVRGVRQKLLAYELFLNKYPEWRENVVLLQVATSTTENSELLATVADITTRIDAQFSTLAHQPVLFLMQDMSFTQYVALLSAADVLMITSLREGMGLTAQEFVFCQDGALCDSKHGPVILSEFTGTAAVFGGNHLSVNPWDYQQCADTIKKALEMDDGSKKQRFDNLHRIVMHYTGGYWARSLKTTLAKVYAEQSQRNALTIPRLSTTALSEQYKNAERRLFILDLEGTLALYGPDKNTFITSQQPMLDTLNELLSDRRNIVYVMSSRTPEELESIFCNVPSLGLVAENGCFLREYSASADHGWIAFSDPEKVEVWKQDISKVLNYYAERIDGSRIEERNCSLVLHYEWAEDPEGARSQAGDCINHMNDSCDTHRIHAIPIDKSVLIESLDCSKATTAMNIFNKLKAKSASDNHSPAPDFLMVAGDAREDEAMFRWANELGSQGTVKQVTTVSMGKRNTEAQTTLTQGPTGLLSAIQKLSKISQEGSSPDYFDQRKISAATANSSSMMEKRSPGSGGRGSANLYLHSS